jgi:hypothetical protein
MAKKITVKKVKSPYANICGVCGKGCTSMHTVFNSENKPIQGIKQCIWCLGGLTNTNK